MATSSVLRMRKQYTGIPTGKPNPALPSAISWTPYLRVRVSANHQNTPSLPAVVDSGAPFCLFRADVADFLHLDLKKCPTGELGGIIGGPKDTVYFHRVNLIIENNWTISVVAGFMRKLGTQAILGRVGFFDLFDIKFDHSVTPPELEINKRDLVN